MKKVINVIVFGVFLAGCASGQKSKNTAKKMSARGLLATAWVQKSGEFKALYYQGYALAKLRLEQALRLKPASKLAIVADIDETVLDNSPYQAWAVKNHSGYPTMWKEWVMMGKAKVLPGAREFFDYAKKRGVEIYYVSNRKIWGLDATVKNFELEKIPFKKENIFLRVKSSGKEKRRNKVSSKYEITLLLGDNLADFSDDFEKKSSEQLSDNVDRFSRKFGNQFIVFPNPLYGSWEGALYNNDFKKSHEEKDKVLTENLNSF